MAIFSPGGFTRSGVTNVIRRSNKKCYHFFSLFFARKSPVYTPVKLPIFAYFCKSCLVYTPVKTQQKLFSFLPAKLEYTYSLLLDKRSFRTRYMNLLLFWLHHMSEEQTHLPTQKSSQLQREKLTQWLSPYFPSFYIKRSYLDQVNCEINMCALIQQIHQSDNMLQHESFTIHIAVVNL